MTQPNRPKLRIAIIGINYAPETTGIAPYTTGLATGLADRGHRIEVLTGQPHYPQWLREPGFSQFRSAEQAGSVTVRRFRHYVPRQHTTIRRSLMEATFGLQTATATWHRPDAVICVSPPLIACAMTATRSRFAAGRPPLGIVVQDLYSRASSEVANYSPPATRAVDALESFALRRADRVAVIHRGFARDLERLGVEKHRISEIRNWTHVDAGEVDQGRAFREARGWSAAETIVLHAGNMGWKQGLENVVDAARLAEQNGSKIRFVLLGHGHQRGALARRADGLSTIEFIDPVSDAQFPAALAAADVLLVNESPGVAHMAMPSKLTSYFRAGKPILAATDEGGFTAEEITASGAGIRVGAGRPDLLLAEAIRLGTDQILADRLGEAGHRYCDEMTSATAALDKYEDWVYDLATSRDATRTSREREEDDWHGVH